MDEITQVKMALLSNMSHELRTPLNGIIGFAQMLSDEMMGPVAPDQRDALETIATSARRLLEMIEALLELASIAGPSPDDRREAELGQTCLEVQETFQGLASQKRIQLSVTVDPDVEHVAVDPGALKQLARSFVSNAIKFTPEGGTVVMRALRESDCEFRLQVCDTGIGIAARDFHRLFVAFEQLDGGTTKRFAGLGVGLALAKSIADRHGGRVGVNSRPNEGSTFYAVLPHQAVNAPATLV